MVKQNLVCSATKANKIMIVDDQAGIRLLLKEVFKKEGYPILTAGSGDQALKFLKEEDPKLVLLDMKIPKMSGMEILHHMMQMKPNLKVMIMTAYGENTLVKEALRDGAIAHFSKPFDLQELIAAVEKECPQCAK
ncbi:response regulator [Sporolactobacillus sp. STCC-11]|uniref:response regulator n=1 Tax=Sporolactobacillus caesalpiniae TaxID=3230362 RepID=UPI003397E2ED